MGSSRIGASVGIAVPSPARCAALWPIAMRRSASTDAFSSTRPIACACVARALGPAARVHVDPHRTAGRPRRDLGRVLEEVPRGVDRALERGGRDLRSGLVVALRGARRRRRCHARARRACLRPNTAATSRTATAITNGTGGPPPVNGNPEPLHRYRPDHPGRSGAPDGGVVSVGRADDRGGRRARTGVVVVTCLLVRRGRERGRDLQARRCGAPSRPARSRCRRRSSARRRSSMYFTKFDSAFALAALSPLVGTARYSTIGIGYAVGSVILLKSNVTTFVFGSTVAA